MILLYKATKYLLPTFIRKLKKKSVDNSEHRLTEMELPLAVICVLFLCVLRGCYPPAPMDADLLVFVSCHSVGLFCLKKRFIFILCV